MDKCEGCPLDMGQKCLYWDYGPDDCTMSGSDKELLTDFLAEITGDNINRKLLPSDFTVIRAAIEEGWRLVAVPPETEYVDGFCREHYEGIGTNIEPTGRYRVGQDQGGE